MMPYDDLMVQVLVSLERARALDGIEVVRDLYEYEVDQVDRGCAWLLMHPDHWTGRVPGEVMREITRRREEIWPTANHTDGIQR